MKTKKEIQKLADEIYGEYAGYHKASFTNGYTKCQEDMADKDKWTFEEILNACYPTLGRGSDWCDIVKRLREQKLNKQD